jgi:hypothetical protein
MEDPRSVYPVAVDFCKSSLDTLNDDVLYIICHLVNTVRDRATDDPRAPDGPDMPGRYPPEMREQSISAIQSLSMTSKHFRSLSVPWRFQSIKIGGSWKEALVGLRMLQSCPDALIQAR